MLFLLWWLVDTLVLFEASSCCLGRAKTEHAREIVVIIERICILTDISDEERMTKFKRWLGSLNKRKDNYKKPDQLEHLVECKNGRLSKTGLVYLQNRWQPS